MKIIFSTIAITISVLLPNLHSTKAAGGVPFVYQAVAGGWSDPRLADACEEASILMAVSWATNTPISTRQAYNQIIGMTELEKQMFGYYEDTSARDTSKLMKEYFNIENNLLYDINTETIKRSLALGNLVIVPINGQKLNNPHYLRSGPPRHMIVISAYDKKRNQFIINDPGVRAGKAMRFSEARLQNALQDYSTGKHIAVSEIRTAMIEVPKQKAKAMLN